MSKIKVLPDILINQVAAGEVIERPASVVKELIENSIDAGATHIEVDIRQAGLGLIRVIDNGCGMTQEEAPIALIRHATSKLQNQKQLESIETLGFRGEALPSIACVSRFLIRTRSQEMLEGVEVKVEGGANLKISQVSAAEGTVIEVRDLFYNVLARKKFLKTSVTEISHIDRQIRLYALANPSIAFFFRKEGSSVLELPAMAERKPRIECFLESSMIDELRKIEAQKSGEIEISGAFLPARFARKGRRQQFLFVNNRPIVDATIFQAAKLGFCGALGAHDNPACWLWINLPSHLVDFNVHPAKLEARFQHHRQLADLVRYAVQKALFSMDRDEGISDKNQSMEIIKTNPKLAFPTPLSEWINEPEVTSDVEEQSLGKMEVIQPKATVFDLKEPSQEEEVRVIGVLGNGYVLFEERGRQLVVLNPQAAFERLFYDELWNQYKHQGIETQSLLVPQLLEFDKADHGFLSRNKQVFEQVGLQLEPMGGQTWQLLTLPTCCSDSSLLIKELIDELISQQDTKSNQQLVLEILLKQLVHQASISKTCQTGEAKKLWNRLMKSSMPYMTARGNPTLIAYTFSEFKNQFKLAKGS